MIIGTVVFALFAVLLGATLHLQTLEEERFLARVHGSGYARYRCTTPRYMRLSHLVRLLRSGSRSAGAATTTGVQSSRVQERGHAGYSRGTRQAGDDRPIT